MLDTDAAQRQHILDLEQALRLHLAVGPDDPLVVDPVEQEVVRLRQRCEHHKWKQEQNEQEVDRLRQQLATVTQERDAALKTIERIAKLEQAIREVCGSELNCLSNMNIGFVEKAVRWYQDEIATRDRTIAAMAKRAMSLVPGAKNVDEAWGKLADREQQIMQLIKEYKDCGLRVEQLDQQITYLQTVSTQQVQRIRDLECGRELSQ